MYPTNEKHEVENLTLLNVGYMSKGKWHTLLCMKNTI